MMASLDAHLVTIAKSQSHRLSLSPFAPSSMYLLWLVKRPNQCLYNSSSHGVLAQGRNTLLLEPSTLPFS